MPDQHENVTSPEEGRARARLTATLMFVLGAVVILPVESVAWLLVSVVLDFPEGTDSEVLFIGLWLVIVVVPLVLLWVTGGRRRRWFATGAAASMVLLLAYFGVTANASLRDPDAGQRLAEVSAGSQVPIYSVGPKFHGWTLDDVGIDHGDDQGLDVSDTSLDPGETLFLGYGTTCTASTNGSCGDRFELDLHAVTRGSRAPMRPPVADHAWDHPGRARGLRGRHLRRSHGSPVRRPAARLARDGHGRGAAESRCRLHRRGTARAVVPGHPAHPALSGAAARLRVRFRTPVHAYLTSDADEIHRGPDLAAPGQEPGPRR